MAPTISEIAHVTQRDSGTEATSTSSARSDGTKSKHKSSGKGRLLRSSPGYDQLFKSIIKTLEDAYLMETALTATELWQRADFSGIPEKSRPSYTAFCTYLRHKVVKGDLISRPETVAERQVRRGKPKAPFNRFANLYALPMANSVPEVTKPYAEYSPLTEEQKRFAEEHEAVRVRGSVKDEQEAEAEVEAPETQETAEPRVVVLERDQDELAEIQRQIAEIRQQNAALRRAVSHISKALAEVME